MSTRWSLVALCVVLSACRSGGDAVEIERPPSTAPVTTFTAEQLEAAPTINLDEAFRIDGEVPLGFSWIHVAAASSGEIIVVDEPSATVFVFDSAGTPLRRFGGKGEGPGELGQASHVGVVGDTIYVVHRVTELSRFTVDGTYLSRGRFLRPVHGLLHSGGVLFGGRLDGSASYYGVSEQDTFVVSSIDGATGNSLIVLRTPTAVRYKLGEASGAAPRSAWLVPDPKVGASPGGRLLLTTPEASTVDVYDVAGNPVQRLVFEPQRREVTQDDVRAEMQRLEDIWTAPGFPIPKEEVLRTLKEMGKFPHARFFPVVAEAMGVSDRELLVERADLSSGSHHWPEGPGPTVWDLVTLDGQVLGRVELPSLFLPVLVRNNVIIGTVKNADGVPSVLGLRMQRAAGI